MKIIKWGIIGLFILFSLILLFNINNITFKPWLAEHPLEVPDYTSISDGDSADCLEIGYNIKAVEEKNRKLMLQMAGIIFLVALIFLFFIITFFMMYDARRKNKFKSSFLANMSQEIRTPMNEILGISEIQFQDKTLSPSAREAFGKIYASGDLLLTIINDILDLSKIEAGKLKLAPYKYDMPSLINDTAQINILRIGSRPIDFMLDIDKNLPAELYGDEFRIKQILNNLISNAVKYTEKGHVKLSAAHKVQGDNVTLSFTVEDTGQGMKAEELKLLFSEYSRFNTKENRAAEGSGLGLNITKRLVQMMDGTISVKSEYGKGSSFTVEIRQKALEGAVIGEELAERLRNFTFTADNRNTAKKRIAREPMPYGKVLVVDDMEANLFVSGRLLAPYRLNIEMADSGLKAIDKVNEGNVYDIIFMDHMMPQMDGIETTDKLRKMGYTGSIVALTANALAGSDEMFLQNGFDAFISKPIDVRQLDSTLNKLIRDKQPPEVIEAARRQYEGAESGDSSSMNSTAKTMLLNSLISDVRKAVPLLEGLFQKTDWVKNEEDVRKFTITVHGLKSSLVNIKEYELSEKAFKLETAGRKQDTGFISSSAPVFLNELRDLLKKLEPEKNESGDGEDAESLRKKLLAIEEMCDAYNRKGALDIIASIKCPNEIKGALGSIHEHVLHSEFDKAKGAATALLDNLS